MRFDGKTTNGIVTELPTIHIVHILDSSGSMKMWNNDKYTPAIQAIKTEIDSLLENPVANYTFTLIEFSSWIKEQFYKSTDISAVKSTINGLKLFNAGTALNDAIGTTLVKLKNEVKGNEKVLVSILTDGEENVSDEYKDPSKVKALIKQVESLGITVTFIGVEQDVALAVKNYGINLSNTVTHDNTAAGIAFASNTRSSATLNYAKNVVSGKDVSVGFYGIETRIEQATEKAINKSNKTTK